MAGPITKYSQIVRNGLKLCTTLQKIKNGPTIAVSRSSLHTSGIQNAIVPFKLSDIGEGIREVVIKEWFIKEGDTVRQFDEICEVQSDKASVTITSRYDGIISKLCHKVDDIVLVGDSLIEIETTDAPSSKPTVEPKIVEPVPLADNNSKVQASTETVGASSTILAIPSVRKFAHDNQVDLASITASGKDGRVLRKDVENYLEASPKISSAPVQNDRIEPIRGYTKAMVKTMNQSLKIPHFVYSDEVVLTTLMKFRNEVKQHALEKDIKLTFMPFFIKAASKALAELPIINSSLDENCENIIYKSEHNIGIAMDTPSGLAVPNIKSVQNKTVIQIAKELNRLQECGSKGNFSPQDVVGGTFTISNIGIIGGTYTKPVILAPEVCILAIGKTQRLPRFNGQGDIVPEQIGNLSWAADHRILDGVTMAKFSNIWKYYVENPKLLLLDM